MAVKVDKDARVLAARALSPKTPSAAAFLDWAAADALALPVVLEEKLKPCWANARFRAWQLRQGVPMRYWGHVRAGAVGDGNAGLFPLVAYGDANFPGTSRGRRAGPTTFMRKTCVQVMGAANVPPTDETGTTASCPGERCGTTLQEVWHFGQSARQRARAEDKAARFEHLDGAPPRDYNAGWHDSLSVRRCVNFHGEHDGVGGGDGPCPNAGRLVSRDGSASISIAQRLLIDMCGLDVPANLRRVAGGRTKPPPLRLERTQR